MAQNVRPFKSVKHGENLSVKITYHPPTDGRVDWDNISNRAKQGFDAVAQAIGVDDGRWWPVTLDRGDKVKGGRIVIEAGCMVDIPLRGTINTKTINSKE